MLEHMKRTQSYSMESFIALDNGNFKEVAKESDFTWKNGVLYGTYMDGNNIAEAEINCEKGDSFSYTEDRDHIANCLKNGVNNVDKKKNQHNIRRIIDKSLQKGGIR